MQHGATQHLAQRMSASGNKSEVSGGLQKVKGRNRFGLVPRNRCLDATVEQRADQVPIFAPDVVRISCGCRVLSLMTMLS